MKSFSFTIEHYTLRTLLHDENFENYYSWIKDPAKFNFIESAKTNYQLSELISFVNLCNESPNIILLGIFDSLKDLHVGNIKFEIINNTKIAYFGILIGEDSYRGIGLAQLVMRKSFIWIKKCLEINKIILGVNRSNQQAIKAYKKFGFLETDNSDEKSIKMEYLIGPTK